MASDGRRTNWRRWAGLALGLFLLSGVLPVPLGPAFDASAENVPPTAVITSPLDGQEFLVGQLVTFDGSASVDEDPANLTYLWDLGGQVISGRDKAIVQRSFAMSGSVLVLLTVTDTAGRNDTTFINIEVRSLNSPPVAIITTPVDGQAFLGGRSITFDGRESYDPDGGTLVFRWETNRTIDPIGTTAQFSIRLPLGRYRVTLFVYDALGAGGSRTIDISVEVNVPPTLYDGSVDPSSGPDDLAGGYNLSVTYRDDDNDPPSEIRVKVGLPGNLVPHDLSPVDPTDVDYRDGCRFYARVPLGNGLHNFIFTCKDPFYSCATVLYQGPEVYSLEEVEAPSLGAVATVNWTQTGQVSIGSTVPPATGPSDTVLMSSAVRVAVQGGTWSWVHLRLEYDLDYLVQQGTISLLWYDPLRGLWVPASGQHLDPEARTVEALVPSADTVMAVFGVLIPGQENQPPNLVMSYDIKDAYVDQVLWFDASCSTDPDGTTDFFFWDFVDDGMPGPWVPGLAAHTVYGKEGTYRVGLMAVDDGERYFLYENVSIRAEEQLAPGPFDNPGVLFMLASLLIIAFGLAVGYRLHRPRTYDDLFGKAYRTVEDDEYSQLFRKLTEEELRGDLRPEEGEDPGGSGEGEPPDVDEAKDDDGESGDGPVPGAGDDEEEGPD